MLRSRPAAPDATFAAGDALAFPTQGSSALRRRTSTASWTRQADACADVRERARRRRLRVRACAEDWRSACPTRLRHASRSLACVGLARSRRGEVLTSGPGRGASSTALRSDVPRSRCRANRDGRSPPSQAFAIRSAIAGPCLKPWPEPPPTIHADGCWVRGGDELGVGGEFVAAGLGALQRASASAGSGRRRTAVATRAVSRPAERGVGSSGGPSASVATLTPRLSSRRCRTRRGRSRPSRRVGLHGAAVEEEQLLAHHLELDGSPNRPRASVVAPRDGRPRATCRRQAAP